MMGIATPSCGMVRDDRMIEVEAITLYNFRHTRNL